MKSWVCRRILGEERGQALVEYGLILFLVSVALVATLGLVTGQIQIVFGQIITALGG